MGDAPADAPGADAPGKDCPEGGSGDGVAGACTVAVEICERPLGAGADDCSWEGCCAGQGISIGRHAEKTLSARTGTPGGCRADGDDNEAVDT